MVCLVLRQVEHPSGQRKIISRQKYVSNYLSTYLGENVDPDSSKFEKVEKSQSKILEVITRQLPTEETDLVVATRIVECAVSLMDRHN